MHAEITHRVRWTRRNQSPDDAIGNVAEFATEEAARVAFDEKCEDRSVTRASVMVIVEVTTCTHSKS